MMQYNRNLDGLRAVAVLMVMWSHFPVIEGSVLSGYLSSFGDIFGVGYLGVDIFFVLSGFLITSILLIEKKESKKVDFKFFYLKRSLRIFPIYFLTLLFCYLFIGPVNYDIYSALFYVSNFYFVFDEAGGPLRHTWSLAVEEQFYIVWPLIVLFFSTRSLERICLFWIPGIVFVFSLYALFIWDSELGSRMLYRGTPFRMLSLGFGGLLAIWSLSGKSIKMSFKTSVIFVAMACLVLAFYFQHTEKSEFSSIAKMYGFSLLSFGLVLNIIFKFQYGNKIIEKILSSNFLVSTGKVSYGLYLYHAVILYYLGISKYQVQSTDVWSFLAAIFLTITISLASFHFFEKKITALKSLYKPLKKYAENEQLGVLSGSNYKDI